MRDYTASRLIPADPDEVFRLLADPRRLPEWNQTIVRLVEAPEPMTTGSQWVRGSQLRRHELPDSLSALASLATTLPRP